MSSTSIYPLKQRPSFYVDLPHTMEDRTPYTYLIGWSEHNIWYYGRRTAKGCHPSDFWVKYFTSSKYVDQFVKDNGNPDIIQIRQVFTDTGICSVWEEKFLTKIFPRCREYFLNKRATPIGWDTTGYAVGKSTTGARLGLISLDDQRWVSGEVVSIHLGKKTGPIPVELLDKRRLSILSSKEDNPQIWEERYIKLSEKLKGRKLTTEHREKLSGINHYDCCGVDNPFWGKQHSAESRIKIGERDYSLQSGGNNPKSRMVSVNGSIFETITRASKVIGISDGVLIPILKQTIKLPYHSKRKKPEVIIWEAFYCDAG